MNRRQLIEGTMARGFSYRSLFEFSDDRMCEILRGGYSVPADDRDADDDDGDDDDADDDGTDNE